MNDQTSCRESINGLGTAAYQDKNEDLTEAQAVRKGAALSAQPRDVVVLAVPTKRCHSRQPVILDRGEWAEWLDPRSDLAATFKGPPTGTLRVERFEEALKSLQPELIQRAIPTRSSSLLLVAVRRRLGSRRPASRLRRPVRSRE